MTAARTLSPPRFALPPVYRPILLREGGDAFAEAVRRAPEEGAGTFVAVGRFDVLDVAVVLEPAEPLAGARRALYAGLVALADALSAAAPPEKPIAFAWPDGVLCDGARLGGGRLASPRDCAEDEVPAWLVFGAMLLVEPPAGVDPGRHPGTTSLAEEGFETAAADGIVEGFARHLLLAFDRWHEEGFAAVAASYLRRLEARGRFAIDGAGGLVAEGGAETARRDLVGPLSAVAWYDPATGLPRLGP